MQTLLSVVLQPEERPAGGGSKAALVSPGAVSGGTGGAAVCVELQMRQRGAALVSRARMHTYSRAHIHMSARART